MALDRQEGVIADVNPADLKGTAIRGGLIVFVATGVQNIIALGLTGVLARILSPEDYGLVGMVFALTAFFQVFSDMGLTLATVQKRELTGNQLSTVFWVNMALGAVLSCVVAAAAPAIGWFYRDARLVPIALWASLGFFLASLGMQHTALLTRRMQFLRLGVCDLLAVAIGGATGIALALAGHGPYALVGQGLVHTLVRSVAAWPLAGWMPGLPVRGSGVRGMLRFGGYLTGFSVMNYFARNLDKVLLGRFWGPAAVGIYSRAYALMMWPMGMVLSPIAKVMLPALSRLQGDRARHSRAHLQMMSAIAFLTFPVGGGLVVIGDDVVMAVYGQAWLEAIPAFKVLCLSMIFQPWMSSLGVLYASLGRTRDLWLWGSVASVAIAVAVVATAPMGILPVATGVSVALVLLVPCSFWFATRRLGISFLPVLRAGGGPLAATGIMMGIVAIAQGLGMRGLPLWARLPAEIGLGGLVYSLGSLVVARSAMVEAMRTLGRLRSGSR